MKYDITEFDDNELLAQVICHPDLQVLMHEPELIDVLRYEYIFTDAQKHALFQFMTLDAIMNDWEP